jgi:hypothetical protein
MLPVDSAIRTLGDSGADAVIRITKVGPRTWKRQGMRQLASLLMYSPAKQSHAEVRDPV